MNDIELPTVTVDLVHANVLAFDLRNTHNELDFRSSDNKRCSSRHFACNPLPSFIRNCKATDIRGSGHFTG